MRLLNENTNYGPLPVSKIRIESFIFASQFRDVARTLAFLKLGTGKRRLVPRLLNAGYEWCLELGN